MCNQHQTRVLSVSHAKANLNKRRLSEEDYGRTMS